jgi:hypothetical protein
LCDRCREAIAELEVGTLFGCLVRQIRVTAATRKE